MKQRLKRTFRNDSIEDIYIYTVTVIPDCVPEKVAYLTERAGTLGSEVARVSTPRYFSSCGALCTYSLYELQVNGAGASFLTPSLLTTPFGRLTSIIQLTPLAFHF